MTAPLDIWVADTREASPSPDFGGDRLLCPSCISGVLGLCCRCRVAHSYVVNMDISVAYYEDLRKY